MGKPLDPILQKLLDGEDVSIQVLGDTSGTMADLPVEFFPWVKYLDAHQQ